MKFTCKLSDCNKDITIKRSHINGGYRVRCSWYDIIVTSPYGRNTIKNMFVCVFDGDDKACMRFDNYYSPIKFSKNELKDLSETMSRSGIIHMDDKITTDHWSLDFREWLLPSYSEDSLIPIVNKLIADRVNSL